MEPPHQKNESSLTPSQQRAVEACGNVLVMAGAGTGKTTTLIARCLDCLGRAGAALDELLIVTFTEAAAAKLRQDLRAALENKLKENPGDFRYGEQLALFDHAHIGTLHSFCLNLVREHFYELGLDPQLAVLDEGEARQCANETLDEQFRSHYEGADEFSADVQDLIQIHGGGRDEKIRQLILRLHNYSQARPDAAGWLARQRKLFSATEPADWQRWLLAAIAGWRDEWLPVLAELKTENAKAAELAGIIQRLTNGFSRELVAEVLAQILATDGKENFPKGKLGVLRKPLEDLFAEAAFLASIATIHNGSDPLAEDWRWVRGHMETLLRLAEEFAGQFSRRKLAAGALDFHDLEQFALKLLWDFAAGKPTAVAELWRKKLRFVFVDEYQDINAAQDKIIAALSRDAAEANRFLVGDVKQSIYRFRLADPKIFRDYARDWHGETGRVIPLAENFRSREGLLNFVNSVCRRLMRPEIGGVDYNAEAELQFGSPETRADLGADKASAPRVELLVRFKRGRNDSRDDEESELADLGEAQKEARLVASQLKQIEGKLEIWSEAEKAFRPAKFKDMAILLRSPRGNAEIFAQEFERVGVPLTVARGGFYQSAEILDLLSLLQLLDNPLQDVPCIAVLRSPLVGLSLDELADIRLAAKDKHFWTALNRIQNEKSEIKDALREKTARFLERFSRWRKLAKQVSLSQCLEEILAETLYGDWLRAQPRGAQRAANLAGFLSLAQSFDQFQRQGLFRFLKFIEAQQAAEVEPEVPAAPTENAVRLMSIHQSKGLEFPVVVLADLAKPFNEQDLRGDIIFDEEFGLCPKVKPPSSGRRYPSLPHWLAQQRQKRELRGEELRLLYVALTRARDNLILTASITEKSWVEKWNQPPPVTARKIADAKCVADWLALWFGMRSAECGPQSETAGALPELRWRMIAEAELGGDVAGSSRGDEAQAGIESKLETPHVGCHEDAETLEKLRQRLAWSYPSKAATGRTAKSSVTALRREAEELDDEREPIFPARNVPRRKPARGKLSAPEIGAAHHKFLQHVALDKTGDLAAEADRLAQENYLSADERAALDLDALRGFWKSDLGKKIAAQATEVRREMPFTARFSPAELEKITGRKADAGLEDEFVVVQGVADLAVLLPQEIWLVDFKTDAIGESELPEKIKIYRPQLQLYAAALEKIFARKVTMRALHFLALGRTEPI
jgi:ATP-dependent helicase/nuclease subunit A